MASICDVRSLSFLLLTVCLAEASSICGANDSAPAVLLEGETATLLQVGGFGKVFQSSPATSSVAAAKPALAPPTEGCQASCLCVFDIDRTLTGRQSDTGNCPNNRVLEGVYDAGYGGGQATLSALPAAGIRTTFCDKCYLGITSAGGGSGEHSDWNRYLLDEVMRGDVQDAFTSQHPESKRWSWGMGVRSPYVLGQADRYKQNAVEKIVQWYGEAPRNVCIEPQNVYFFGDRTENIEPFRQKGLNSHEVSCASRDHYLYHGSGMVGYCGATPQEIQRVQGNTLCSGHDGGSRRSRRA